MFDGLIELVRGWYGTSDFVPLHEPRFGKADRRYVMDAIDSTFVSSVGAYVDRFEQQLRDYTGAAGAVATVNGTAALQAALRLVGVTQGDEVITQPLSFIATANAAAYLGASPVFVDIDPHTLGLSPDALQRWLETHADIREGESSGKGDGRATFNRRTGRRMAAIVPMHTFGHPCQIEAICAIAEAWHIPVVEDAAEALGATVNAERGATHCGTFGRLGVYSFNGNKVATTGGGGAIITHDESLAAQAKHLTTTAKVPHRWETAHDQLGYNFRMPNLNAALGCAQLERLDTVIDDKRQLADAYAGYFDGCGWATFVREPAGTRSSYWLHAVLLRDPADRDRLLQATNDAGVMTRPAWALLNTLPMYADCETDALDNARDIASRLVNLPSSARVSCGD